MSYFDRTLNSKMPCPSPLEMPRQDFSSPFIDGNAPGCASSRNKRLLRIAAFLPAIAITCALVLIFSDWFSGAGFAGTEIVIMMLVAFSGFWIALSVTSSAIGLVDVFRKKTVRTIDPSTSLKVALLVPIYNENPKAVCTRISAMQRQLDQTRSHHKFAFFVLSDTQDLETACSEEALFANKTGGIVSTPVYYRRREKNIERKTGNIRDWIQNWGGDWDAFVTLDADSLMGCNALVTLADDLSQQHDAGLIQSVPRLVQGHSLFARAQQFANNVYGGVLASGLEKWSGNEGNYWGHNAIIRTKAFAACAGLPILSGKGSLGGIIKSHDFVEAALLRRAGWSVYLRHDIAETYEETPQTLVDYVLRDRRWCQGNLQHLRLLTTSGLAPISRFHMLQGAMAYIASVAWFALLIVWTLMGRSESQNVFRYFTDSNPLFPQWPQMDAVSRIFILCFMISMLLMPKLFGLVAHFAKDPTCARFGGKVKFATSAIAEILLSVAIAPIMMVQHVLSVARTVIGKDTGWAPQNRDGSQTGILDLIKFHCFETAIGILLFIGMLTMMVSTWLTPIAISLLLAVPLSYGLSKDLRSTRFFSRFLATPQMVQPAAIIKSAYEVSEQKEPQIFYPEKDRSVIAQAA